MKKFHGPGGGIPYPCTGKSAIVHIVDQFADLGTMNLSDDDIRRRLALAGLPTRLKDLGLSIDQLVPAAEDAAALDLMNYIPRAMSSDDLFDLIKQAY